MIGSLLAVAALTPARLAFAQDAPPEGEARYWLGVGVHAVRVDAVRINAVDPALTGILGVPASRRWTIQLELSRAFPSRHTVDFANLYGVRAPSRKTRSHRADVSALARAQPNLKARVEFAFLLGVTFRVERIRTSSTHAIPVPGGGLELIVTERSTLLTRPLFGLGAEVGVPVKPGLTLMLSIRHEVEPPLEDPAHMTRAGAALRWRFN
jgi:hypothetical protein